MRSLKIRVLILVFVLTLAAGAILNGISVGAGGPVLQPPLLLFFISLVIAGITLFFGLEVRKYSNRQRRKDAKLMDPLLAARTAVFAQACAYTGAVMAGWSTALLVFQIPLFAARQLWAPLLEAGANLLGGLVMVIVGLIVEAWCKIPPEDGADTGSQPAVNSRESQGYARND